MEVKKNIVECVQRIRLYDKGERLPTSEGYMELPDINYRTRWDHEDEDNNGWSIEFYFNNRWIKGYSIDFE